MFIDVPIVVDDDLLITIMFKKLPGFWKPSVSNFEIFREEDAPEPFVCPGDTETSDPTASPTPTNSVDTVITDEETPSPSPSPSVSATLAPTVSASPSEAVSVTPSTSLPPTSSASPSSEADPSASPSSSPSNSPSNSPSSSPSPSPGQSFEDVDININAGVDPKASVPGTDFYEYAGPVDVTNSLGLPGPSFSSLVQGADFSYVFDLPPGTYNVILGFVELLDENCVPGARVFNVLINGNLRLEAFDIYATGAADDSTPSGCQTAVVERFLRQTVDALNPQPLVISFVGIAGMATVSHMRIIPSLDQCVPVTTNADITDDHLAHAVPGDYPPNGDPSYVDRDGKGYVWVTIDGSGSHTHFSYGSKNGRVTNYLWTIADTGKVISTKQRFVRKFLTGTTRLRLAVIDDACSRDEAETSVTVTGRMQPGAYCYYYNDLTELPAVATLHEFPRPLFAAVARAMRLGTFPDFPFATANFVTRCTFFVDFAAHSEMTDLKVDVGDSGVARLYKGVDLVLDTNTSANATTSTSVGLQQFELLYHRTNLEVDPRLVLRINDSIPLAANIQHDQSTVLPILTAIDPDSGREAGGSRTKLTGYGLFAPLNVSFGPNVPNVSTLSFGATATQAFVNPPAAPGPGPVQVTVTSSTGGTSNPVTYTYGSTCDPVAFTSTELTMPDGSAVDLGLPTAVTSWSDGKLYVGSRLGVVRVVEYDHVSLTVVSVCKSEELKDPRYVDWKGLPSNRSILGITFDPRDTTPRPYVTLSTLFWQRQATIRRTNPRAWSNGAVARLKPASAATMAADPEQCLEYDTTVVRNLPVSDGDHSVNELVFTQEGDILIAVGGNTNAGLPYAPLGGNWETYLAGAVVIAKLSRPGFNGTIDYSTPDNLRTAVPATDDVDVYATGVRNMFAMAMARSGRIYGADMGPNCRFGNASSTCDEYVEADAALRSTRDRVPFPGKAIVGPDGDCKYGDTRRDKLIRIQKDKYYGHSNLQRAAITGRVAECGWIDPETDRTGKPAESPAPSYYSPRMARIQSPMTAVAEYGSNLFCGRLRNNLILSRYKGRGTFRVRLRPDGLAVNGSPERFNTKGGLRVQENVLGDLIFPKLYPDGKGFFVMRPVTASKPGVAVVNALPFRHGAEGGTVVMIGGWGFGDSDNAAAAQVVVEVGGLPCPVTERKGDYAVFCTVPPYRGGGASRLVDVSVTVGETMATLPGAIRYMDV